MVDWMTSLRRFCVGLYRFNLHVQKYTIRKKSHTPNRYPGNNVVSFNLRHFLQVALKIAAKTHCASGIGIPGVDFSIPGYEIAIPTSGIHQLR